MAARFARRFSRPPSARSEFAHECPLLARSRAPHARWRHFGQFIITRRAPNRRHFHFRPPIRWAERRRVANFHAPAARGAARFISGGGGGGGKTHNFSKHRTLRSMLPPSAASSWLGARARAFLYVRLRVALRAQLPTRDSGLPLPEAVRFASGRRVACHSRDDLELAGALSRSRRRRRRALLLFERGQLCERRAAERNSCRESSSRVGRLKKEASGRASALGLTVAAPAATIATARSPRSNFFLRELDSRVCCVGLVV